MIIKNFEQWTDEDIQDELGYSEVEAETQQSLLDWLNFDKPIELSEYQKGLLEELNDNIRDWNKDELKLMFIGPLLTTIKFNNYPHYKVFSQRKVTLKTETIEAQGKIEWLLAQGKKIPKKPFFFLHEYKKELGSSNDPLGQLLIAMVYAQEQNQEQDFPIYGIYIVGRNWFFVILEGKEYAVSRAYDATQEEGLQQIIASLHKVKQYIHQILDLKE